MLTENGYFFRDRGDNGYVTDNFHYRDQIVQDSMDLLAPDLTKVPSKVNVYTKAQNNPFMGQNGLK